MLAAREQLEAQQRAAAEWVAAEKAAADKAAADKAAADKAAEERTAEQERQAQARLAAEQAADAQQAAEQRAAEAAEKKGADARAAQAATAERKVADVKAAQQRAKEQPAKAPPLLPHSDLTQQALLSPEAAQWIADQKAETARLDRERAAQTPRVEPEAVKDQLRQAPAEPAPAPILSPEALRLARAREEAAWRAEQPRPVMAQPSTPGFRGTARAVLTVITANLPPAAGAWRRMPVWSLLAPWVYTALIAWGWGYVEQFGWKLGDQLYHVGLQDKLIDPLVRGVRWVVQYSLAAVVISLVLAVASRSLLRGRLLALPVVWFGAAVVGWGAGWLLNVTFMPWSASQLTGYSITGVLGGLVVAWAVLPTRVAVTRRHWLVITAGWAAAVLVTFFLHDFVDVMDDERLLAVLAGALGAGVMFWQLRAVPSPAAKAPR